MGEVSTRWELCIMQFYQGGPVHHALIEQLYHNGKRTCLFGGHILLGDREKYEWKK